MLSPVIWQKASVCADGGASLAIFLRETRAFQCLVILYAVLLFAPVREQNLSCFQFKTALLAAAGFLLLTGLFFI